MSADTSRARFSRYAWFVLSYNILVILWGAFVRATGSGAGCGSHWPFCNGEVVPRAASVETLIELTHRLTSGLALIAVAVLVWWAFRAFPTGDRVRRAALWSAVLLIVEALLGAGLVLLEYVAGNRSVGRVFYLCAHLTNTLLLLGALTVTAWLGAPAHQDRPVRAPSSKFLWAFLATLFASVTGAIAALGDTLYPATSLLEGVRTEFTSGSPALLRLRLLHPVIAGLAATYVAVVASVILKKSPPPEAGKDALAVELLVILQIAAGLLNVALLAPVWMQILHLLIAALLWIALVRLWLNAPGVSRR